MVMVAIPSATAKSIDMSASFLLPAQQVAGHHHAMHLRRALAEPLDAELPVPALERHLLGDAEAAEDLDAAVNDLDVVAEIAAPGRLIDEKARRPQLDLGIRDHPLDRLLVRQQGPEGGALA